MSMEVYRDFYGCVACLRVMRSGAARLTVRTPGGKLIHAKNYKTRRGARVLLWAACRKTGKGSKR